MSIKTFDFLVVGTGLIGSAALRWISAEGGKCAILGPKEPLNPSEHKGVFGAHYDEARITTRLDPSPVWSALASAAIERYDGLQSDSGIEFHQRRGCLYAVDESKTDFFEVLNTSIAQKSVACELLTGGEAIGRFPFYSFQDGSRFFWEENSAGLINPRRLIEAQLKLARNLGARVIPETALEIRQDSGGYIILDSNGEMYFAGQVLVAAGAFSNCFDLLPRKLALTLKSEFVVFAQISEAEVRRLSQMPPLLYENDDESVFDIYLLPPVRYPDGKWYLKLGANSRLDRELTTFEEIRGWYAEGDSDVLLSELRSAMERLLPGLQAESWHTKRCVITRTVPQKSGHRHPYIDAPFRDDRGWEKLFVAVGGNGRAAKSADEIGRLAAELMTGDARVDKSGVHRSGSGLLEDELFKASIVG